METVSVPLAPLEMPPPLVVVELLFRMELETVRVPALLNAPPLPAVKVNCPPETVTPEIERLPPELIVKILKPPTAPLMVSEEAPGPVMVTVPAVPPVIAVLASIIVGNTAVKVMVPAPPENREEAKSMVSLPAVVLARVMASLKVITLSLATVSAKEVT